MRILRSSALTLAVSYIALGLVALALFAAPLWYAWRVTVAEGRVEILQADAQRLGDMFRREGPEALTAYLNARVGLQIAGERLLLLADPALRPLAGNLAAWPGGVPTQPGIYTVNTDLGGGPTEVLVVHGALPRGYHLLVGRDNARFRPLEQRFWYALTAAVAIMSIVGAGGGILVRRAVMARINGIQESVSEIIRGDLSHRLPMRHDRGELDALSQTINGMLDQIEQLIGGVRNVSNAIAHDLRTPLAELRSRLEELTLTRPAPEQTFAELEQAVADVDQVIRLFNALLRLAEIDSGMRRSGFVATDLAVIAAETVEFYQPAAEQRGLGLALTGDAPAPIRGDPLLLAQALGNLIDNALKYAPPGSAITVSVGRRTQDGVEVTVTDCGPGIPDADKRRVTERFYRGDSSRGTPGVGLGLSLVAAVSRLHGGALRLEDNQPGLRARMTLPGGVADPAARESQPA